MSQMDEVRRLEEEGLDTTGFPSIEGDVPLLV